jgi:hypothetical protein
MMLGFVTEIQLLSFFTTLRAPSFADATARAAVLLLSFSTLYMFKLASTLSLGALLTLATACSKQDAPSPTVGARTAGANYAAPIDPPVGGGGGGGEDAPCTESAPSQTIKDRVRREARITCRDRGWAIVTTITPPDGFTFGIGCPTTNYPFSIDVSTPRGNLAVHGYYDPKDGSVVVGYE